MRFLPSRHLSILISITILFSSCTSVFHSPVHNIHVATNIETEKVTVNNRTRKLLEGRATTFEVTRSKESLVIGINDGDSLCKVEIGSRNTFSYLYATAFTFGLSTLIERKNPKRYYYQKNIYFEKKGDVIRVSRFAPGYKGMININFSMPYGNYFHISTTRGNKDAYGFMGLAAGVEYFYKNGTYLSIQGGAAMDFLAPVPAPVKYGGLHDHSTVVFGNIRNNHTIRSFDLGYGLSVSRYLWYQDDTGDPAAYQKKISSALGLSLSAQYRITKNFRTGLLYQPAFLSLDKSNGGNYQHLLSLELVFKFRTR